MTAGGKNVAPQPIEGLLKRDPLVAEAVLVGDRRRFVSVLLVPDFPTLEQRLAVDGLAPSAPADLVRREDVQRIFQPIVDQANSELASYQQVKRFALLPAEFSVATGELTPTLKVKRRVVEETLEGHNRGDLRTTSGVRRQEAGDRRSLRASRTLEVTPPDGMPRQENLKNRGRRQWPPAELDLPDDITFPAPDPSAGCPSCCSGGRP